MSNRKQYADWKDDNTPTSLWDRVLDDDHLAWQQLLQVWTPCVFELCTRRGIQNDDATDIAQQVMIRVYKYRDKFSQDQEGYRLKAWLLTIIKRCIADYFRGLSKNPRGYGGSEILDLLNNFSDKQPDTENNLENEPIFNEALWMAKTLEVIRSDVSELTWQVFEMFKIQGFSAKEVGEKFDLKPNAVRQRVFSVTERIKKEATGLFEAPVAG